MFEVYDKLPVCHDIRSSKVRTKDVILNEEVKFSSLLLEEQIQQGLVKCGYCLLSPIQKNALPLALTGTSIVVHAKSGTGKTLVYLLTALNSFLKSKPNSLFTLILAPTREIAKQVYDVCKSISCFIKDLKVEYFIGGIPLDIDVIKCKGCHIAIGAPGRIKHLIDLGELKISELQLLVLDEVDELIGNEEFGIKGLVALLPASRQTIVCTATYSDSTGVLLEPISSNLKYVNMTEQENQASASSASNVLIGIKQYIVIVPSDLSGMDAVRKRNKLLDILKTFDYNQCFVFVNYISSVKSVYHFLLGNKLSVLWMSSEQSQATRMANLNKVKMGEYKILVTTDVSARGIDVHNATLVINFGFSPSNVYLHRMGRAGRYGTEGAVITIVQEGRELASFKDAVGKAISEPVYLYIFPSDIRENTLNCPMTTMEIQPIPPSDNENKKKENQTGIRSKKKRNRKRKAKEKVIEERAQRSTALVYDSVSSSDKGDVKRDSDLADFEIAEKLINEYKTAFDDQISKRLCLDSISLLEFLIPTVERPPKMFFTHYYGEPIAEKTFGISDVLPPPDAVTTMLQLTEFVRKQNSFLDEQKIPCSTELFYTFLDNSKSLKMNVKKNGTDVLDKLTKDIVNKLREFLALPPEPGDTSDDVSERPPNLLEGKPKEVPAEINQHEPSQIRSTVQHVPTSTENALNAGIDYPKETMFPANMPAHNLKDPIQVSINETVPTVTEVTAFSNVHEPLVITADTASQNYQRKHLKKRRVPTQSRYKSASNMTGTKVQCPQCQYRFNVNLNSTDSNVRQPTLTSLTPYVSFEMEQQIFQNHFNYIARSFERFQSNNQNN